VPCLHILLPVILTAATVDARARSTVVHQGSDMTNVASLNNQADRLITAGRLDEADRVLDRVRATLDQRPLASPDAKDFTPALDEYFYRVHRVSLAWRREQYGEALPHAQRAWEVETGLLAAARRAGTKLGPVAFSSGAWGIISVQTRLRRFTEAEQHFKAVLADREAFAARHERDPAAAEKILLAGLCIYFEAKDAAFFARGRAVVEQAQAIVSAADSELVYGYACYWARLGQAARAFAALATALGRGIAPERALADEDFASLKADPRFQELVTARVLTWKIASAPAGARLWLDGVDTGLDTPARLRPPAPGRHVIRLTLAGHREVSYVHDQQQDTGLDVTLALESITSLAQRQKMADDSKAAPDAAAKARTSAFLGPRPSWVKARVRATRAVTYGMGEAIVTVEGDGRVVVRHTEFAEPHRKHEAKAQLSPEEVGRLFEAFVEEAFTEMVFVPQSGKPDEPFFSLELSNAKGERHELGKFVSLEHQRFERLLRQVAATVARHLDEPTRKRLTLP
jgi:hypothetical protein